MNHELLNQYNHFAEARKIPKKLLHEFKALEKSIRYGSDPDAPYLIRKWDFITHSNARLTRIDQQYNLYYQYYLLLDVIADDMILNSWRQYCVKEIYIPMERLHLFCGCKANQHNARALYHQLYTTLQYTQL